MNPHAIDAITPSLPLVLKGEIWRLIGFVFIPPVVPDSNFSPVFSALFMFFVVSISFLINDSLERAWGEFRTSIYVYSTIFCQSLALHLIPFNLGIIYYTSLFLAFATVFPHVEFRLFLIIPVKVWILAAFTGILFLLSALTHPFLFLFLGISLFPYLVWAIPMLLRWKKNRAHLSTHRKKFEISKEDQPSSLHCCAVCGKTEISHPHLAFRVAEDGEEYCLEHLPPQN